MAKDEVNEPKMNPFMKNMLKGLIPMISGKLPEINGFLKKYLTDIELLEWETKACILCMMDKTGTAQIITCTLNADEKVKRLISKVSAVDFITNLLKNF